MKLSHAEQQMIIRMRKTATPQMGITRLTKKLSIRKSVYVVVSITADVILVATENAMKSAKQGTDKVCCEVITRDEWTNGCVWNKWELV